ncbi:hypothetical protein [Streptomyces sp. WMMB 714]|nr:hypothetical protein [Streptomyces sp. WMMB 714]
MSASLSKGQQVGHTKGDGGSLTAVRMRQKAFCRLVDETTEQESRPATP